MLKQFAFDSGFTLIELLITISIGGIIVSLAIPNFSSSIRGNRLTSYANEFVSALNYTRSEAVKRGQQVTMKRKPASASQHWELGWDIFLDINGDAVFADNGNATLCETNADGSPSEDCLLKSHDVLPTGATFISGATTYKDYAAYKANGASSSAIGDAFVLCATAGSAMEQRTITINSIGHSKVTQTTGICP